MVYDARSTKEMGYYYEKVYLIFWLGFFQAKRAHSVRGFLAGHILLTMMIGTTSANLQRLTFPPSRRVLLMEGMYDRYSATEFSCAVCPAGFQYKKACTRFTQQSCQPCPLGYVQPNVTINEKCVLCRESPTACPQVGEMWWLHRQFLDLHAPALPAVNNIEHCACTCEGMRTLVCVCVCMCLCVCASKSGWWVQICQIALGLLPTGSAAWRCIVVSATSFGLTVHILSIWSIQICWAWTASG